MRKIVALVGVMAVVALAAYTYSAVKQAKYMYQGPTTISVVGKGEVFAKPDIASFSFSVESKEADATAAQNKAGETMDAIVAYLKDAGVDEKDIKTGYYSLSPRYEYPEIVCASWGCPPSNEEPKLIGYQVSQSVTVKVRDTEKAGELVSGAGDKGAMNVSGLSFTIDDEDALKTEARELAIKDAREKGEALARNLGTRIVRMNGYWEEEGGYPSPYYGMGGDSMMKAEVAVSEQSRDAVLPTGENTITVKVNISYEIK
jgi:hypothetical protein